MAGKKSIEAIRQLAEKIVQTPGFNRILPKLNVLEAADGRCLAEFTVVQMDINLHGSIHGGFAAAVVDYVGSCALISKGLNPGASVHMQMMYPNTVPIGAELIVEAKTISANKTHAYVECEIRSKTKGIISKGCQTKYITGT